MDGFNVEMIVKDPDPKGQAFRCQWMRLIAEIKPRNRITATILGQCLSVASDSLQRKNIGWCLT
jgi:hypothetical protein